ncbi:S-adenosyl-L-methionine-dependent methyltransferase [Morchella conica CCBAS932]|uniref:S-adenosyl-L-methionine-dependent methyltransferase n=1 Tax=Morchella conica CCBAS932 TaxID=1392247 RepID=A0A3N4KXR6_9PEZI|nr:S-adenosyl-L-methionine-dependent methyltransferase [Morchella conica CCBAS932]
MAPAHARHLLPARLSQRRFLATASNPNAPPTFQVFNRAVKRLQRDRAAANKEASRNVDYLKDEVADRLVERILLINRPLPRVLDLGAGACHIARSLTKPRPDEPAPVASRISHLICTDMSPALLHRDADAPWNTELSIERIVADEESPLPFAESSLDAVVSSLSMQWINDLPGALSQVRHLLKPDAPFVAAMVGGDTLFELRTSLQLAESERLGGVSPRVSPLADVRDVGGLLQTAGFTLLTVDVDDIVVGYPDVFALMADLGAMGEGNAVLGRKEGPVGRDVLVAAQAIYRELHGNEDGTLPATFRIIYMIGWKASENQPKPLPRGSGQISMKDILEGSTTPSPGGEGGKK